MTMLLRVIFALPILLIVCGQQDRCRQERKIGRCLAYFPRFYYNASSGQCEAFVYGGCEGNENNFENLEECQKSCENQTPRSEIDNTHEGPGEGAAKVEGVCKEKAEKGPCRALITRWHYNDNIGECRTFTYGGCRGNGNNFHSKEDCEKQCKVREIDSGKVSSQVDERAQVCSLPGQAGRCRGHFRRWMFNPKSQLCEEMVYGGCGGNRNNFRQKEDCEKFCILVGKVADGVENGVKEQETDVCAMPRSSGPCRGKLIRWAFDAKSQTCEKFHYGGCGGNKNNHLTKEACEVSCDPCSQPLERGSCSGQTARWYYNTAIKTCVPFLYSGCGGNRNNFADAVECSQQCGTHSRRFVT